MWLCTDGSKGSDDPEMTGPRLTAIRQEEQRAAGRALGLKDIAFLGYPDAYLEPTLELRRDLAREIRRHRPDVVIAGPPLREVFRDSYISHPDHLAAGEAALAAVFPTARDRLTFPELLAEGAGTPQSAGSVIGGGGPGADHFVDVADYMETAMTALKAHQSQITPGGSRSLLPAGRRETRKKVGLQYAEAFKRIKLH